MQCRLFDICHRDEDVHDLADGFCILHAEGEKSTTAFNNALEEHRKTSSDFRHFVFPTAQFRGDRFDGLAQFSHATFPPDSDFSEVHFAQAVDFSDAHFTGNAFFQDAKFDHGATFTFSRFAGQVSFDSATFSANADLAGTTFAGPLSLIKTHFAKRTSFGGAEFTGRVEFIRTTFGSVTSFCFAIFRQQALFQGDPEALILHESAVDFRFAIGITETIRFRNADLRRCRFDGTDCRRIEFTNVCWARQRGRVAIFDEIVLRNGPEPRSHWTSVERLYRELKQNHEDRRDYERAGDFHYGEKEMRRRGPDTPAGLRGILFLYWLLSGYGERILRPLSWAIGLLLYCAVVYILGGVALAESNITLAFADLPQALRYSFEVMFFLSPDDLVPRSPAGQWLRAIEAVLGPIFLGLFAVALRQRLKR